MSVAWFNNAPVNPLLLQLCCLAFQESLAAKKFVVSVDFSSLQHLSIKISRFYYCRGHLTWVCHKHKKTQFHVVEHEEN